MMNFAITSGVQNKAQRIVIYGTEGVGKTLFCSKFPKPVYIDTEGGTYKYNLSRLPKPSSWTMLLDEITFIRNNPYSCDTLVIDTADWAELLAVKEICDRAGNNGLEDFGYGNGYTYLREEFAKMLNLCDELIELGIHVVICAHAVLRKMETPGEMETYDRWEIKLGKKTTNQVAPLLKEWSDMLIFCNFQTLVMAKDDKGTKFTATGGKKRMMYCNHSAIYDAKNRHGLPDEAELDYRVIEPFILPRDQLGDGGVERMAQGIIDNFERTTPDPKVTNSRPLDMVEDVQVLSSATVMPAGVPKSLWDLMQADNITVDDIQRAVTEKGFFPAGTPIANYGDSFINGMLIGSWEKFKSFLKK